MSCRLWLRAHIQGLSGLRGLHLGKTRARKAPTPPGPPSQARSQPLPAAPPHIHILDLPLGESFPGPGGQEEPEVN